MKQINERNFDQIIESMLGVVDKSKDEIYELTESSREEQKSLTQELEEIRQKVKEMIARGDQLEKQERIYRNRLAQVSKNFNVYTEKEIKDVYVTTHDIQAELKWSENVRFLCGNNVTLLNGV